MSDNPLMKDVIRRHSQILETADPASPEFRRAKAIVEEYRHEEILSGNRTTSPLTGKHWYENSLGMFVLGVIGAIIAGGVTFYLGWT